ncbi:hypothetical protein ACFVIM_15670 [Streptomyces sp. NPDC057638]|uniref:hypothetical protein n=1 Tax=Streptomyces sp. NPDC057638 TaxID=3346190 RepID=UPI00368861CE
MSLRSLLSAPLSMPRMLRHGSAVGADLPPDGAVTLDQVTDPALRRALAAARLGDAGPARELLAETRLGARWEYRSTCVAALAECALHSPQWLERWLAAEPAHPDATLLRADLTVRRAWEIRTDHRAVQVSHDRFRAFFALLEDAAPLIAAAVELNPADPVPWEVALSHARGMQSPREVFDAYWTEAVTRSPYHYGCHASALQYLCRKWYGSDEEMFGFAERSAASALPGSLLHALPLLAAVEYALEYEGAYGSRARRPAERGPVGRERITAAVDRALALSAWYGPGDPEAAGFRNHLAMMLILGRRWDEALEVFRAIGTDARAYPWAYLGESRKEFLELRLGVRMQIASRTPFFGRPPGPRTPSVAPPAALGPTGPHALAIVAAAPRRIMEAAPLSAVPLRVAAATPQRARQTAGAGAGTRRGRGAGRGGGRGGAGTEMSYVEQIPGPSPWAGGEEPLVAAVGAVGAWPALVLFRTAEPTPRAGVTLVDGGRVRARHLWDPAAPVVDHTAAAAVVRALAAAFPGVPGADRGPLVALLRGADDPARRQRALVAALGLPQVPDGFGERADVLDGLPGARIAARRSWAGRRRG